MSLGATTSLELSIDAYCTMSHIRAKIPQRSFDGTSFPTLAQAVLMARAVYKTINPILDVLGYVVPVASGNTTAIGFIQELNAYGAAAQIEVAAYAAVSEQPSAYASYLDSQHKMMWKTLQDGKASLPGAARKTDYMHRDNEKTPAFAFDLDSSGNETDPTFTKEMKW